MNTIKLIAALAVFAWATASFAQQSGHGHGHGHAQGHTLRGAAETSASSYAGEQARAIKSLSEADINGLLSGAGAGYAKAAELNGYPGPAHVLALAPQLGLRADQQTATQRLMDARKAAARQLGEQLVSAERALDAAFAVRQIDAQRLQALTQRIGSLQASLRAEHLQTHLAQTALLEPRQVARYAQLRGYTTALPLPSPPNFITPTTH